MWHVLQSVIKSYYKVWQLLQEILTVNLQSYFLDVLPMNISIMAEKGLSPFEECSVRCVHLSLQEGRTVAALK